MTAVTMNRFEVIERVKHIQDTEVTQLKPIGGRRFFALLNEIYGANNVAAAVGRLYTVFEKQEPEFIERIAQALATDKAKISPEDQKYLVDYVFQNVIGSRA
jgi:hypothetical protein